jgi:hypothetical protein
MVFRLILFGALLIFHSGLSNKKVEYPACTFNGIKLYGKVQFVENFPDIKIQFVTAFPDIKVEFVDVFPDIKVQVVDVFPGKP